MKTLTEKIIGVIIARANEQHNPIVRRELETVIEDIKKLESDAEFEEVARVMMKHMANGEKYHPHMTVIIDSTRAEILEGVQAVGTTFEYVQD